METLNMSESRDDRRSRDYPIPLEHGNAICYSGYRQGQSPAKGIFPTYDEVKEDLLILEKNWDLLRLYDCGPHALVVLKVIRNEGLDLKVMLGLKMSAERNKPDSSDTRLSEQILAANRQRNSKEVKRAIGLANRYPDIVFAVSVGNGTSVDRTDHMMPLDSLIRYVRQIKKEIAQPVTFCENHAAWSSNLESLAAELDFIAVQTYPVRECPTVADAVEYTQQKYYSVAQHYPDKRVILSGVGWTTASNGCGIEPANATEELQAWYYEALRAWTTREKILTFVFEAFDEPWKGSSDPLEPEKHWGLFNVDRSPKLVMQGLYSECVPANKPLEFHANSDC
jgi:exo-beta-1,3-glucanase (GH17 family)